MSDAPPAPTMPIGSRVIGRRGEVFIIAEAGVNHDGDLDIAHRLVDAAAAAGADAVKFQAFEPALLVSDRAATAAYQQETTGRATQREMLEALTLPQTAWAELASHARDQDLAFLCTAFDQPSLEAILDAGIEAVKVPSGELTNVSMLRGIAALGLPVLLSTGMSTLDEVRVALAQLGDLPVCVLHCVSSYPAAVDEANLDVLPMLQRVLGCPVGWSDHTTGSVTAVVATALGATVLEKHLTLDQSRPGPDHRASADPRSFREMVEQVRAAAASLGDGVKRPQASELAMITAARRSFHVARPVRAGARLEAADLVLLRPGSGLPPGEDPTGRTTTRDLETGELITAEDLVPE